MTSGIDAKAAVVTNLAPTEFDLARAQRSLRLKNRVAKALECFSIFDMLIHRQAKRQGGYIRAVNYHGTSAKDSESFERHLEYFKQHYVPVSLTDLIELQAGNWRHHKPGILISFDDATLGNGEIAAPLLKKHGFIGWFFVPTQFVDTEPSNQDSYAKTWEIDVRADGDDSPTLAMSWDQIRQLKRNGHVIGCHTYHHRRLQASLTQQTLSKEIVDSKKRLAEELGDCVETFSWVGGREHDYSQSAAQLIRKAGYIASFMTNSYPVFPGCDLHQLQRTHMEASWDLPLVKLQLSGLVDRLYREKRERVNSLTKT